MFIDICSQYPLHLTEVVRRRKLVAVALFLILERGKRKQQNRKKRLWARYWLQRRNTVCNTLTMLHEELRFVICMYVCT